MRDHARLRGYSELAEDGRQPLTPPPGITGPAHRPDRGSAPERLSRVAVADELPDLRDLTVLDMEQHLTVVQPLAIALAHRLHHHGTTGRVCQQRAVRHPSASRSWRGPRIVSQAVAFGSHIGQFAEGLLDAPFPWSKLRQGPRLLRLAESYTPE